MSVLVVVTTAEEAGPLVRWGARFARARDTTLKVLHLSRGTKAVEPTELPLTDPEDANPIRKAIRSAGGDELVQSLTVRFERRKTELIRRMLREAEAEREQAEERAKAAAEGKEVPPSPPPEQAPASDESLARLKEEGFLTIRTAAHNDHRAAVLAEIKKVRASLLIVGKHERTDEADLSEVMMADAPCDTMLLRAQGVSGERCRRVLVPAAGGPHSVVSLRLAGGLSEADQAVVSPLYVASDAGDPEEARELGERSLASTLRQAGLSGDQGGLVPTVALASNPQRGIAETAKVGAYDLVLVGATHDGFVKRMLFGTVPDKLLAGPQGTAVAVVRAARPLSDRAMELIDAVASRWLPQLERADRVTLFERLQEGSRFGFDFAALITLSTGIASLGLMQNSAAVVIGAMLVAPLMTPMIGAGLALVQGNTMLVSEALRAILKGIGLAVAIGLLMGAVGRVTGILDVVHLTPQLLARGAPTALDLIVAYLSGLAAAYALARPSLSGALPGVAIAAALVPPLGTVGISLSAESWHTASGSALLFGTNLVAIVLGAATVFRAMGVHGSRSQGEMWAKRAAVGLALSLCVLAAWFVVHLPVWVSRQGEARVVVTDHLQGTLRRAVERDPRRALLFAGPGEQSNDLTVVVSVSASGMEQGTLTEELRVAAKSSTGRDLQVRLVVLEATQVHESSG